MIYETNRDLNLSIIIPANANTINRLGSLTVLPTKGGTNSTVFNTAVSSIACNNPKPAVGGGPGDSAQDIKLNAMANFAAQKRTVTKEDYIFRALAMPPQFGKVQISISCCCSSINSITS